MKPEFISQRRTGLQQFLSDICDDMEIAMTSAVGDFISRDSIISLIDEKEFKRKQLENYQKQQALLMQESDH